MKQVPFDGEKLYKIFQERGLTVTEVARKIGVNIGYFSNAKTRGTISELVVTALEVHMNIPRNKYLVIEEPKEEVPKKEKKERLFSEHDKVALYELIYSAVYNAMKKALNE